MAYSSVEHMGVIALGFGFGGALGVAGALYHMLNHSLNKSLMFFGAGNMMRSYGTKEIARYRTSWAAISRSRRTVARRRRRHHRRTAVRPVRQRTHDPARRAASHRFAWAVYRHGRAADRHLHRFPEPFPHHVFRATGAGRMSRRPTGSAPGAWRRCGSLSCRCSCSVCGGRRTLELFHGDRARSRRWRTDRGGSADEGHPDTPHRAGTNCDSAARAIVGSRRPDADGLCLVPAAAAASNCATSAHRRQHEDHSRCGAASCAEIRPSLADDLATAGLVRTRDHRSLRHPFHRPSRTRPAWSCTRACAPPLAPPIRPRRPAAPLPTAQWRGTCIAGGADGRRAASCRSDRCAPMCSSRRSSSSSTSASRSCITQPHLFFKHRGMEKRFEGVDPERGVILAERVSGVGSVAHALAFCQAVEAACELLVPPRACGCACCSRNWNGSTITSTISVISATRPRSRSARRKASLLEERAKQINARLTGSRFLRSLLDARRTCAATCVPRPG